MSAMLFSAGAVLQRFSFVRAVLEEPVDIVVTEITVKVHVSEVVSTESGVETSSSQCCR